MTKLKTEHGTHHHDALNAIRDLLARIETVNEKDTLRPSLVDTPNRVLTSYGEIYAGYHVDVEGLFTTFEADCEDMVILRDVEFYSTCEHHMLPFIGRAHIGYLPGPDGKVIGVSKIARLLDAYARRLQIQERIGQQVTSALMQHLGAAGAAAVLEAQHLCMTARGVAKQHSVMVTSSMVGSFRESASVRAEFLALIGK